MAVEIFDIYDIHRVKTGGTMLRGSGYKQGEYHIVVHACIFNSNGEMLIQQRQSFKRSWPDMWDVTVAGCATIGDTSQEAIAREIYEEIGVDIDMNGIRPHLTINFECGFDDVYIINRDLKIEDLKLQVEEVKQVKWASIEEICEKIESGTFIPYYKSLIQLFFDIRLKNGCYKDHN